MTTTHLAAIRQRLAGSADSQIAAEDTPRLLAAVDAVLAGHEPRHDYEHTYEAMTGRIRCDRTDHDLDDDDHGESEDGDWLCLHRPLGVFCRGCWDDGGDPVPYPCASREAITEALGGDQ